MAPKKVRPIGKILLDLEKILGEMIDSHDLQWYDVLFLVYGWLMVHRPDAQEEYTDGSKPVFYYGPKEGEK